MLQHGGYPRVHVSALRPLCGTGAQLAERHEFCRPYRPVFRACRIDGGKLHSRSNGAESNALNRPWDATVRVSRTRKCTYVALPTIVQRSTKPPVTMSTDEKPEKVAMNRTILASAAAGGLMLSPFAVQAGTAASAVTAKASQAAAGARRPLPSATDQKAATSLAVAVVIAAGAATYGRVKVFRGHRLARAD